MWMQRVFDLKSPQNFEDSKEEVIKLTMVKQEMAFRNQVDELHRLYGVQKSLMKDLSGKDDDWYYQWDKAQSYVATLRNKFDPLVKESASFLATKADSSSYIVRELLNGYQDSCFRLQKRPLNLQLSADEFIEFDEDNLPKRGKFVNFLQVAEDSGHLISVYNPSGAGDLNLSLCIGVDRTIAGDATRNCFNKKVCSSPPIVIDLEDFLDNVSDVYPCTPLGCATPQSHSNACSSGNHVGNNDNHEKGGFLNPSNWQHETRDMVVTDEVVNPAAENFNSNNGSINSWGLLIIEQTVMWQALRFEI